jgi:hypothetical protein
MLSAHSGAWSPQYRNLTWEKNIMDNSSTFLFEVVFSGIPVPGEIPESAASDRSVIVEVDPDNTVRTAPFLSSGESAREWAKELAPQFAMQVVQKDLPHGFEPPYSVNPIDQLPRDLHLLRPKFQGDRFRAWLL